MRGLGRIFERGDTYWIAYYYRGREYRESTHLPVLSADRAPSQKNKRKAEQCLKKKWQDLGQGKLPGGAEERVTVEEILCDLETDHRIKRRASLRTILSHIAALLAACPERAVDVTSACFRQIIKIWQTDRVADATINRRRSTLRRAFQLAYDAGKLTKIPKLPKLDEHNAREGFFDKPTFLKLLAALPDDGLRDFVEWAFWTGMRKGEITALTWDAFDRETWTLRLHARETKTRRGRRLVLARELRAIIERRLAARRSDCRLIFHRHGEPIRHFRRSWITACNAAGVTGRLFHDLRRTGVRNLMRAGVKRATAMKISGHRTESVFERYNIDDDDDLRTAVELVSAYVEQLPKESTVVPLTRPCPVRVLSETRSQSTPIVTESEAANS